MMAALRPRTNTSTESVIYFPTGSAWELTTPQSAGWSETALARSLELAAEYHSSGVVFLHRGRIVAEQYWTLDEATVAAAGPLAPSLVYGQTDEGYALEDVASAQKSVVAVLCLIARDRGLIAFNQPVSDFLGSGWTKATREQEKHIRLYHLLSMTTGLNDRLEFEAVPGTRWHYNTPAYQKLLPLLMGVSKLSANELTQTWLGEAIGWQHTYWVERPFKDVSGQPMRGIVTTARDLARFGLLILSKGLWDRTEVIAPTSVAEMLRPSQALNPAYGLLWWLNDSDRYMVPASTESIPGRRLPDAPQDMATMAGLLNRYVFVIPSWEAVIVRMGVVKAGMVPGNGGFDRVWWKALRELRG
ncbi:MAG: serine hydrolase domain-containing protein [Dehalococcoidia bacterium]